MHAIKKRPLASCGGPGAHKERVDGEDSSRKESKEQGISCTGCAYLREIPLPTGGISRLCQFTGEKRPKAAADFCRFTAGRWEDIDRILRLTAGKSNNNLDVPNFVRPCSGLGSSQESQKVARHNSATNCATSEAGMAGLRQPDACQKNIALKAVSRISSLHLYQRGDIYYFRMRVPRE